MKDVRVEKTCAHDVHIRHVKDMRNREVYHAQRSFYGPKEFRMVAEPRKVTS